MRHWLRDVLSVLHQRVVIASHGLGCMAESIRNDIDEVLDLVAIAGAGGCNNSACEQRRGDEGGGADMHSEERVD